jgi:hypothetical protein
MRVSYCTVRLCVTRIVAVCLALTACHPNGFMRKRAATLRPGLTKTPQTLRSPFSSRQYRICWNHDVQALWSAWLRLSRELVSLLHVFYLYCVTVPTSLWSLWTSLPQCRGQMPLASSLQSSRTPQRHVRLLGSVRSLQGSGLVCGARCSGRARDRLD